MAMRIATFAASSRVLDETLRSQAQLAKLQLQEASGKISTDYGGLGSTAGRVINVEVSKQRAQAYADAASLSDDRVQVMYDTVGSLVDLLTQLRSDLASASSGLDGTSGAAINATAAEMLNEAASLMNSQFEGRYLFSGSRVDTKPVDVSSLAAATATSAADTSYYQGDDTVTSVRVSNDDVVSYGVLASDPAFEKTLRALNIVANMTVSPLDSDALDAASDLVLEAIDGMTTVQTKLSLNSKMLERAEQIQTDYVDQATSMASALGDVDVAAVAASLSTYEAQVQAAYSAIAKVQALSLVDYLR